MILLFNNKHKRRNIYTDGLDNVILVLKSVVRAVLNKKKK